MALDSLQWLRGELADLGQVFLFQRLISSHLISEKSIQMSVLLCKINVLSNLGRVSILQNVQSVQSVSCSPTHLLLQARVHKIVRQLGCLPCIKAWSACHNQKEAIKDVNVTFLTDKCFMPGIQVNSCPCRARPSPRPPSLPHRPAHLHPPLLLPPQGCC